MCSNCRNEQNGCFSLFAGSVRGGIITAGQFAGTENSTFCVQPVSAFFAAGVRGFGCCCGVVFARLGGVRLPGGGGPGRAGRLAPGERRTPQTQGPPPLPPKGGAGCGFGKRGRGGGGWRALV
jgi:hypothetical protein